MASSFAASGVRVSRAKMSVEANVLLPDPLGPPSSQNQERAIYLRTSLAGRRGAGFASDAFGSGGFTAAAAFLAAGLATGASFLAAGFGAGATLTAGRDGAVGLTAFAGASATVLGAFGDGCTTSAGSGRAGGSTLACLGFSPTAATPAATARATADRVAMVNASAMSTAASEGRSVRERDMSLF
jgi:hypothetical protein